MGFADTFAVKGQIDERNANVAVESTQSVPIPIPKYKPKLRIRELSKRFSGRNGEVQALLNVNMDIEEGEFVCVVGQSGCGKTTLLNLIAEFEKPDNGSVEITNTRNNKGPQKLVIFQEPSLFPWLNVTENVEFGLKMAGKNKSERVSVARDYLTLVGLERFSHSYIHELSGGMKQRVALARALAMDPELLLMDEPFAALDPQTRHNLHNEMLRISSETKKTILFITHNIDEAIYLADRVLVFTPHPGTIRKEFEINLPKPRNIESGSIRTLTNEILNELCIGGECPNEAGS